MTTNPVASTAGPNSRTCADFDGVDDFLTTDLPLSDFISADAAYVVISLIVDAVTGVNHAVLADTEAAFGLYASNAGGLTLLGFNDAEFVSMLGAPIGDPLVIAFRHEDGAIYLRVNLGPEHSVASGDTSDLTGTLQLAMTAISTNANIKVFEIATFECVPPEGVREALEQDFMSWVGAESLWEFSPASANLTLSTTAPTKS